jgi:hypothetical protein
MKRTDVKIYKLDGGVTTTVKEVMAKTGLSYAGSVCRLHRYTNPDLVMAKKIPRGSHLKNWRREVILDWESKPSKVCGGIPFESSYKDGQLNKWGETCDRYGKRLTIKEEKSLFKYKEQQRKDWLKNKE